MRVKRRCRRAAPAQNRTPLFVVELAGYDQDGVDDLAKGQQTSGEKPENARADLARIKAVQTRKGEGQEETATEQERGEPVAGRLLPDFRRILVQL